MPGGVGCCWAGPGDRLSSVTLDGRHTSDMEDMTQWWTGGGPPDNGLTLKVGGEAWVRELCGPCGMVHKVRSSLGSVPYLPALRQLSQCLRVNLHVAVPRVVPGAGPRLLVDVVHLSLSSHTLLWGAGQVKGGAREEKGGSREVKGKSRAGQGR